MSKQTVTVNSTPYGFFLFLVFLVLKLTNHIDWSWWWVTAPLWIPAAFVLVILTLVVMFVGLTRK